MNDTSLLLVLRRAIIKAPRYLPVASLLLAVTGCLWSVSHVPDELDEGVLLWPVVMVMTCGLLAGPAAAILLDPTSIFRAEHLVVLAPVYFVFTEPLQSVPNPDIDSVAAVRECLLLIGIFVSAMWCGSIFTPASATRLLRGPRIADLNASQIFLIGCCSFVVAMLKFAIPSNFSPLEMFHGLMVDRWSAPWARGQFGGSAAIVDHLSYIGYLLPALCVVHGRRRGFLHPRTCVLVALTFVFSLFIAQGGGRRGVGVLFGCSFIVWLFTKPTVRRSELITLLCATLLAIASLQVILSFRDKGVTYADAEKVKTDFVHVDEMLASMVQLVSIVPERHAYTGWSGIKYYLFYPIPRFLWSQKPTGPGFDLALELERPWVSLSNSVIGEAYTIGGWPVVAMTGLLFGAAAKLIGSWSRGRSIGSLIIVSSGSMMLFAGFRSFLDLISFSYVIMAWIGFYIVFRVTGGRLREVIVEGSSKPV